MSTPKPAETRLPAPARLLAALNAIGYTVELVVSRAETATVDSGSDPGPVDAPITDVDKSQLAATLKAYAAGDEPDGGARFEPPRK